MTARAGPHGNGQECRDEPDTSGLCRTSEVPAGATEFPPSPETGPQSFIWTRNKGVTSGGYKTQVIRATVFERQTGLVCLSRRK